MNFNRVYKNTKTELGFSRDTVRGLHWLKARRKEKFVSIRKSIMLFGPYLTVKQARKFANKILKFCDDIESEAKDE